MSNLVKRFCNTFLIEGLFVIILGILLLVLPQLSTLALSITISVALILAGIYKLISSVIRRNELEKSWLSIILSLLMIVSGAYLTVRPLYNLLLLTMGISIYFVLEGINSIIISALPTLFRKQKILDNSFETQITPITAKRDKMISKITCSI